MICDVTDRRVDGCYGWIVVMSGFCLIVLTDGILFTFGNLLIELTEYFDADRARIALIGALMLGFSCFTGPISGGLCDRFGCRMVAVTGAVLSSVSLLISSFATNVTYLYLTYGVLGGTGVGFMYLSANVIAVQYFNKHRGLACGITLCGSGVGMFIFNLVTRFWINEYGWRGTVLLEAGMCIQGSVFGLLLLPPIKSNITNVKPAKDEQLQIMIEVENCKTSPNNSCDKNDIMLETELAEVDDDFTERDYFEIEKKTEKEPKAEKCSKSPKCKSLLGPIRNMFDISLLTDVKFVIFLLSLIACHLAYSLVLNMTVDRSLELGMTKYESAWLASSIGIASTIGRAVLGWFGDRHFMNKIVLVSVLLLLLGLSTMLSCFLKTFSTLVIYSSIYGFFAGGYIALCPTVLAELFSAELIARSFGLYFLFIGISSTAATPIGGFLYDTTGSYDVTFVVAGVELLMAGVLIIVLRCVHVHYG